MNEIQLGAFTFSVGSNWQMKEFRRAGVEVDLAWLKIDQVSVWGVKLVISGPFTHDLVAAPAQDLERALVRLVRGTIAIRTI